MRDRRFLHLRQDRKKLELRLLFRFLTLLAAVVLISSVPVQARPLSANDPPVVFQSAPDISTLVDRLPYLLGYEHPMNYLVLVQITDELRPNGGFIKFVIFVRLENGTPTEIHAYDVTRIEPVGSGAFDWVKTGIRTLPPSPIEKYMGLGNWVLRDANWWGDFRNSAAQIVHFWEEAGFDPVDGVIAVNDLGLSALLDVIGGIKLADGATLTGTNFKDYAIAHFYQGDQSTWSALQQNTADSLIGAFAASAVNIPRLRLPLILSAMSAQAFNHNVMAVLSDPETAEILNDLGFDGSLRSKGNTDYFYLVEADVSYSKSSPFIDHALSYTATLERDTSLTSRLEITFINRYSRALRLAFPGYYYAGERWDPQTRQFYSHEGYYGAYVRVYVPSNAQIINAAGFDTSAEFPADPSPLTVVGGYIGLESGEQQQVQIEWKQDQADVNPGNVFRLYVQRQPGLPTSELSVGIHYPVCAARSIEATPAAQQSAGMLAWTNVLDTDRIFTAHFPDGMNCS